MPRRRKRDFLIRGFSKLLKEDKLKIVSELMDNQVEAMELMKSFWLSDKSKQKVFDEFSENTLSNFYIPYGVAPNVVVNGRTYHVPVVIEESSVVAAASSSSRFWSERGGFKARVIGVEKIGQVHFLWNGKKSKLVKVLDSLKLYLREAAMDISKNMEERGGGITDFELLDFTKKMDNYYQLKVSFNTVDSMGANFINSCLEEFASALKEFFKTHEIFSDNERECEIIMSILSNYTPNNIVKAWVECDYNDLNGIFNEMTGEQFARKFQMAVKIAETDIYRATTHNKGVFNGVDAVAIATGNDFRAIEAAGHAYATKDGSYKSLTKVFLTENKFRYELTMPMSLGTVGGLTSLHPLAKHSLEMLGNPKAKELMMIVASVGLASNFAAIRSLVTKGIQIGHMKMHLFNILNHVEATKDEKEKAIEHFVTHRVSHGAVKKFIQTLREN
ncbi:MAG: hydroxymethylglutaryl-CoA reductase [Bacteroidetes bacterium]|nr:hydroxymethylglutaryl-CoA reductase [Bacteroidota bacterium]MBL6943554.1 hydroxymethylglutaryl-CoA reductase [Bacteroidales bacterium]